MEPEMVSIRCPGCGQRFRVGPDLQGKMVECGSCDHRFRVGEEVEIRNRKFYPGEHRDPTLERFSRLPMQSIPEPKFQKMPGSLATEGPKEHEFVVPDSPQRVIFGFIAVIGSVIVALLLMFAGGPGGILDGAGLDKRLVLAGFTSLLAGVLLFLANKHQKHKAALGSVVIAACLITLPFVFTQGQASRSGGEITLDGPEDSGISASSTTNVSLPENDSSEKDPYQELKIEMGYQKMEDALATYGVDGVSMGRTVIGVWLKDIREFHKNQVFKYLVRESGASDEKSWSYPRDYRHELVVLHDVPMDLARIEEICRKFGQVKIYEDLNVVEVQVNNEMFVQGPLDKLQDPEDPAFYELNRRELQSIDLQRAHAAVKRLTPVEPRVFRKDIVARFHELMEIGGADLRSDVARALTNWSEEGDGSVEVIRNVATSLVENGRPVPESVIGFLVSQKDEQSKGIMLKLWRADEQEWESEYGDLGPMIEDDLISIYPETKPTVQLSALRLLGRVGTRKSLHFIESLGEEVSAEHKITAKQALSSIHNRLGLNPED